jgi:hypothetical protein
MNNHRRCTSQGIEFLLPLRFTGQCYPPVMAPTGPGFMETLALSIDLMMMMPVSSNCPAKYKADIWSYKHIHLLDPTVADVFAYRGGGRKSPTPSMTASDGSDTSHPTAQQVSPNS